MKWIYHKEMFFQLSFLRHQRLCSCKFRPHSYWATTLNEVTVKKSKQHVAKKAAKTIKWSVIGFIPAKKRKAKASLILSLDCDIVALLSLPLAAH